MNPRSLLASSALLLALTPAAGRACSLSGFPIAQGRATAFLVVTTAADTVEAGAGDVSFEVSAEADEQRNPRTVYGQVADVERIGGAAARGLDPSVRRVVLVPWGYGADCRTTIWMSSARWVEPGTRGLFTAALRDRAHWAGGLPTFDIFTPYSEPYPQNADSNRGGEAADSLLSIEDYASLLETLPVLGDDDSFPAGGYDALFRWARERPALAAMYPAREMLDLARYDLAYERLRSLEPPLVGTWRFEARLGNGAPRVVYARTRERPTTWWNTAPSGPDEDPNGWDGADGYSIVSSAALLPDSLPLGYGPDRDMSREGYLYLMLEPERGTGGQAWRGKIETELITRFFPHDAALQRFARDAGAEARRRDERGEPDDAPARFVLAPGGTARVEQTIRLRDGRTLRVTGTRISRTTIAGPE